MGDNTHSAWSSSKALLKNLMDVINGYRFKMFQHKFMEERRNPEAVIKYKVITTGSGTP